MLFTFYVTIAAVIFLIASHEEKGLFWLMAHHGREGVTAALWASGA